MLQVRAVPVYTGQGISVGVRLLLACFFFLLVSSVHLSGQPTVLVLNSYHEGYAWSDSLVEGIASALHSSDVRFRIEYMDTKYVDPNAYEQELSDLYARKYRDNKPDVIIATDISAKYFLARHHDELFPGIPTVLVGAHDFRDTGPRGDWWTGVYPELPVHDTLELMFALQPGIERILVIAEETNIGRAMHREIQSAASQFDRLTEVRAAVGNDIERLMEAVETLPPRSAILLTLVTQDAVGSYVPPEETLSRFVSEGAVPVYSILDIYAGIGIVGGVLVESAELGRRAAVQALRLLDGENVSSIPVISVAATKVLCDWEQLRRFGIPESRVPKNAVLVNAPNRTVEIPRGMAWATVAGIVFLLVVAFVLVRLAHRQKQTQSLLKTQRQRLERSLRAEASLAKLAGYLNQLALPEQFSEERISGYLAQAIDVQATKVSIEDDAGGAPSSLALEIAEQYQPVSDVTGSIVGLPGPLRSRMSQAGYGSFVLSVLTVENVQFGWVLYLSVEDRMWREEDLDLLSTVTNLIAATWDRFRAASTRLEAERREQEARAMLERSGRLASIGVMAAGITHEIAQPLNYIKMTTDSLRRAGPASDSGEIPVPTRKLSRMVEAVDRIAKVVAHMRDYWTAPAEAAQNAVDTRTALSNATALLRQQLVDHGVELVMDLPPGPVIVHSSMVNLEQIVVNLVGNAIQALDLVSERRIEILLRVTDDHVEMVVEDTGLGIDDDDLPRVFDPFYSSKPAQDGMGLGLAIVRSLVERGGGTIEAYRNSHGGAGFSVRFPPTDSEVIA